MHISWCTLTRTFTVLLQKAPGSGELVTLGVDAAKPFVEVGIISGIYILVNISNKLFISY